MDGSVVNPRESSQPFHWSAPPMLRSYLTVQASSPLTPGRTPSTPETPAPPAALGEGTQPAEGPLARRSQHLAALPPALGCQCFKPPPPVCLLCSSGCFPGTTHPARSLARDLHRLLRTRLTWTRMRLCWRRTTWCSLCFPPPGFPPSGNDCQGFGD